MSATRLAVEMGGLMAILTIAGCASSIPDIGPQKVIATPTASTPDKLPTFGPARPAATSTVAVIGKEFCLATMGELPVPRGWSLKDDFVVTSKGPVPACLVTEKPLSVGQSFSEGLLVIGFSSSQGITASNLEQQGMLINSQETVVPLTPLRPGRFSPFFRLSNQEADIFKGAVNIGRQNRRIAEASTGETYLFITIGPSGTWPASLDALDSAVTTTATIKGLPLQ